MKIGLALPHYDYPAPDGERLTWHGLVDATRRAESLGFDSAWISDHLVFEISRYGGPDGPVGTPEAFTAIAALVPHTQRIRLGTLVACAPFRHPGHLAKMTTTIDLASGGRFELGLGAGWYRAEFEDFGYDFGSTGERFSVLEETVEVVRALLGGGPVDHAGPRFHLVNAYNHPRPLTGGGPRLWIGGKGRERLLRLVVRSGAGWNTVWRWTVDDYAARVEALARIAKDSGRAIEEIPRSVGLYAVVGADQRDLRERWRALQAWTPGGALDDTSLEDFAGSTLTGTVEQVLERLGAFAKLGVEEMIVSPGSLPFAIPEWSTVELIAERVIPAARDL